MQHADPPRVSPTLPDLALVDDWLIGRRIGRDSWSTLYEAQHRATGMPALMEVVDVDLSRRSDLRLRHAHGVEVLASDDSGYVPEVLDLGDLPDGAPYVVLERLEGETLEERLERGTPSIEEVYTLVRMLLHAVAAIHRNGVVHGDLRPTNVFLHQLPNGERTVKLIGFGTRLPDVDKRVRPRPSHDHMPARTACHAAPEQLRGEDVDERADIYSVGSILYECLTGVPPFAGSTSGEVTTAKLEHETPSAVALRPECPGSLARLASIALARDPYARFRSAMEMLGALDDVRSGEQPVRPDEHAELVKSSRPASYGEAVGWTLTVGIAIAIAIVATLVALLVA